MARILEFSDGFESSVQPTASPVAASELSNTPSGNLSATTVQGALNELQGDVDTINTSKGAINGIATLDSGGKVPSTQMPALAITEVFVVADIAARDALTVEEGDVAKVLDDGSGNQMTYIYTGSAWTDLSSDGALAIHMADTSTHGVSGAIVGTTDAQTLTNKDIDGGTASNTSRITLPKDTKGSLDSLTRKAGTVVYGTDTLKAYIDNGTSLVPIGSGSGSGGLNYITNPDFETDLSGWSTYADAAATIPVDGTGGTASSTLTRSTASPLASTASAVWTKSAANRQGEGFSFDFTIDAAYRGQQLAINYLSQVVSGTYVAGDMVCYVRDLTNGVNIQPSAFQVQPTSLGGPAQPLVFQTASNSTSYRLIFHCATASTSAYTLKFDNFSVGPQVSAIGPAVTDWKTYVPATTGLGTISASQCEYRTVGDTVFMRGVFTSGTPTAVAARIGLPPGMSLEYTSPPLTAQTRNFGTVTTALGSTVAIASSNAGPFVLTNDNSAPTYLAVSISTNTSANHYLLAQGPSFSGSGYTISFEANCKVTGLSSNTIVSDSAATRVVAAKAYALATPNIQPNNTFVKVALTAAVGDTHGGFDSSNNRYIVKVPGRYSILANANAGGTNVLANLYVAGIYKNGSLLAYGTGTYSPTGGSLWLGASTIDDAVPGDYYELWFYGQGNNSGAPITMNAGITGSTLMINMIQGPAQIQAATLVSCALSGSSTSITSSTVDIVPTTSSVTAGTFSTATYTAAGPGRYSIKAMLRTASGAAWVASNSLFLYYSINGGASVEIGSMYAQTSHSSPMTASGSDEVILAQGDTVKFRAFATQTVAAAEFKAQITRLSGVN